MFTLQARSPLVVCMVHTHSILLVHICSRLANVTSHACRLHWASNPHKRRAILDVKPGKSVVGCLGSLAFFHQLPSADCTVRL